MPQDPNKPVSLPEWEETVRSHYGIPKELWSAMADQESGGDWKATSPTGVRGKYQVTQRTARQYNLNRDDPFEQVAAAGRYLKEQFDAVKGPDDSSRWYGALARFYGGPSAVDDQGNFSTRSADGVSNPAEHVARVARRIEAMRKRAQDESLAPAQPQATPQAQTAAPADQPAPIQKAIQPLPSEQVDWTRRGPVMPQRPQPSFAGDPNADALQKMMGQATVAGYKIPKTAEDAFKGRQRYATTPQAPKQSQRPGLLQDVAETALPFAAGGLAPIVSKTMPTPAEGSIRQAANVFGQTYSKGLAQIPQGLAQLGEATTRLRQLVPTQAPPDGLGPVSRIFDKPTQALVQGAEQRFPTNKQDQSWRTSKIPQVLGSVGAFATTGAVGAAMGLPSMASSALAGSGMQVASFMEEAKQTGIDPTRINQGIAMAGLTGMTEMFGLGKVLDRFGLKKQIVERGLNILEEAGQEAFQGYLEDLNAKLVAANDPKRNIDPTSADFWLKRGEEAALGAIGGGLFAGADIVGNRIAARPDGGVAKVPDAVQDEAQPEAQPLIGLPRPPRSVRQQMTELQRPGTPPIPEQIDQAETAYRQRKPRKTPLQERMRQMEPTAPLTEDLGTGLSQGQQAGTIEDRWGEAISNSPRPETVKTALEQAEQAQRQFDRSETDGRDTDALTALQRKDQALRAARVKVSRNTPGGLRARQRLFDEIKGNQRKIDQKKQQMQRRKGQPVSQPDAPVTGPMGDANAPTASGPMMPPTSRPSAALPREYTNRIDSNTDYPGGELPRTAGIRPEGQPIELPERTPPQGRGITPKRTPGPIQRPVGPQRPTTPMMGAEGSMMFADRPGMQYQMSKEGERIVREQEERVAEGTLEEGDFLGPRRARPEQPKFGNYGDVAMYLFKSPQPGDPAELQTAYDPETGRAQNIHGHDSVFNSPEVKGVLGLSRDANMGAVKDEINKDMARWLQLPADEVSLAQVPPSIWVGWAKMKGLSKATLDKMYVAFDKATEKAQREGKEPPPVPQRLQTPFAKRQVSPLAGFTKGTNAQTPPTTQAAPRPREGQPTGRQATGAVEQPTRPATPPAQARAERTGAPTPAADTGELTTGELRQEREKQQELRKRSPFGKDREAARQTEQAREQQAPPTPKSEAAPKPAAAEPEKTYTPEKKTVAGETTRATMPAGGNTMSDTAKQKPTPTPGKVSEKTLTEKGWTKNYSEDFSGPDGATLKRNPETGLWEYTGPGGRAKYDSRRQAIIDIAGKPAPKVEKGEKATPKKRKAQPKPEKQAEAAPAQQPAPAPTPAKKPVADPPAQPAPISVTQIDESINDRARDILMQEKGAYHTPGLRLADQLTAGQMAYLVEKGDLTPQDWDDWVKQAQQENRFRDAAAPIRPPSHLALPVPPEVSSPTAGTRPDAKPVLRFTGSKIAGPGVEGQTAASRLGQRITMLRGLNEQTQAYPGETFDRLDPNQIDEVRDYMIQLGRQQQAQPVAQPEQATPSQAQATPPNLADIMPPPGRPMEMKDLKQKLRDAGMPEGEIDQFILDKKASYEIALMKAYGPDDVKARTTEAERVEMVQDQFGNWYNGATRRTEQETQEAPTAGATRLITKGEIYRDQDGKYFEIVDTVKTGRPAGMLGEQVDRKTSAGVDASDLDARIIVQPLKGKPGNFQPLKTVPARGDDRLRQQISQGTAVRVDPATGQAIAATEPAPSARKPQAAETPAQAPARAKEEAKQAKPKTAQPKAVEPERQATRSIEDVEITIGDNAAINKAKPQVVFVIREGAHYFTLWAGVRLPDGRIAGWNYMRNLSGTKAEAVVSAEQFVRDVATGKGSGLSFTTDKARNLGTDRYNSYGLDTAPWTAEQLMASERGEGMDRGEQPVGFGKHANVQVKDLFAKDANYAMWAADNLTSGRGKSIGDYLRRRPEYIEATQAASTQLEQVMTAEVLATLQQFGMTAQARGASILLGGRTYDYKDIIKQATGRYADEGWTITPAGFSAVIDKLRGLPSATGRPAGVIRDLDKDSGIAELRRMAEQRPDRSGLDKPLGEYVSQDTQALLKRGIGFGMPAIVVDEQIEDVAKIRQAYERDNGVFLLASEPGSGKTFVLGAAIRELRQAGAKKIVYVTLRKELITQIKEDLNAYDVGDVQFVTYPEMRASGIQSSDVLIFDEAHSVKNVAPGDNGAQQAKAAAGWIEKSKMTIFSTATPFENPTQAEYLEPTGIFASFGGFKEFAQSFGSIVKKVLIKTKYGTQEIERVEWRRSDKSDEDAKAAREFLRKEGIFTSRPIRLSPDMVDVRLSKVEADKEASDLYAGLASAAELHEGNLRMSFIAKSWIVNLQKRILEAAKVDRGIEEARSALERGRFPILFVETKAERTIDIPDILAKEDAYNRARAIAAQMHDTPPKRSEFGLPPEFIPDVLKSFMLATGRETIEIPAAETRIVKALGDKNVAIFTGSVSPAKAQQNLDAWRRGDKKAIVATMAKGGTGLSLHDKAGNHPTTQIVINLPWTATQVKQVAQRNARYGLKSKAEINWIFADNIPFDRMLASRVGGRMSDMGATVYGDTIKEAQRLENWDIGDMSFSALAAAAQEAGPTETVAAPRLIKKQPIQEATSEAQTEAVQAPESPTPAQALTTPMSELAVDIAALIDQTLESEGLTQSTRARTPRQTKQPTSPRKRAATSARKAGREAVAAIDESLKALNELFGGPKLSAGFTFDEDTYRKAKPHFQAAFQHFNASVDNLNQTVQDLIATLRDLYGWGAAEFQKAKPYLVRFMTEWKEAYAGQSMATSEASGASSERAEGVQAISGERPTESGARESRTGRARDAESISGTGDGPVAGERIGDGESTGTVSQRARSRSGERGQRRTERDAPPVAEDTTRTATQPPAAANLPPAYVVTDIETLIPRGKKSKLNANLEAVRLFKRITVEGRLATAEEQQTLARYTGWGAFPDLFNEYNEAGVALKEERAELRQLLTDAEYEEARASTKNAHYTSPKMVGAMWDMMRRLGFKQGRVLEPSVGVGTFFGMMPSDMRSQSRLSAVELDPITGGIAKLLYPQPHASISVKGFEAYDMPDGFHDIVIGNVPFGDYKVHDPRYNKYRAPIHDYFILKSLDQVRPGGVVMVITSTGTLDKQKPQLREAMAAKADLVAAFRLPDGIFEQTAGTAVVTDVLVLRRREPGITGDASWTQLGELPDPDGGRPIPINQYYVQHPDNILGRLDRKSRLYGSGDSHVSATEDFETRLKEAIDRLPADTLTPRTVPVQERLQTALASGDEGLPPGSLVTRKGQLMRREGEQMVSVQLPDATAKRVGDVLPIRDALRSLISAQLEGQPTNKPRQALQDAYDAFVRRHGALRKKGNAELLAGDPSAYLLLSLEKDYNAKTGVATKADIFTKDVISRAHRTSAPKHAGDALAASLFEFNRVDIPYMASALGMAEDALATELVAKKLAFELPSGGWDTAEQYLAGNVRRKLQEAQSAAAVDPKFLANVEALEAVQPEDISIADISVRAGAPWVPAEDIADFAASLVDGKASHFSIKYSPGAAEWYVDWNERSSDRQGRWMAETGAKAKEVYGTPDVDFIQLLGAALNDRPVTVRVKSGDTTVTSPEKTEAAMLKVQDIKDAFTDWIWTDPDRANRLHRYYNDNFNNLRTIVYKGEHYKNADGKFVLPGMNPQFALRPHQIKNVWHAVSTGRLLEASEVGAGKTFIMGSIAMEWRRLGMVKKPAIVVPKARLQATIEELQMLYPGARIMDFGNAFQGDKRQQAAAQTATGDYDMVIMTHEQLDFLPMKPEVVEGFIRAEMQEIRERIAEEEGASDAAPAAWGRKKKKKSGNRIVKDLEKTLERLETRLKDALDAAKKDKAVYFEETGIDSLLVDEAHAFKSLPVYSRRAELKGVPTNRSNRATNMFMRTQWLLQNNGNRGVVFATGTPVTNTLAELFNMQRYLQIEELRERGLDKFDAWADVFTEATTNYEYTATGDYKPVTRLTNYVNLPELNSMARQVMETNFVDDLGHIKRPKKREHVHTVPISENQLNYIRQIKARAEMLKDYDYRKNSGDNYLVLSTDARKSALSTRLVDASITEDDGKIVKLTETVLRIAKERPGKTQMIFADMGVNPTEWNYSVYQDVIDRLVAGGIPKEKIINFGTAEGVKRQEAAAKLKAGEYWIGIGSTQKMGTGVNAQDLLTAMHHLDIAWVPAYVEQRNGRGHRQGNTNAEVEAHYYVTEGSFDLVMWQAVNRKWKGIQSFMRGGTERTMRMEDTGDEDSGELSPEMIMAAASGNPYELQRIQTRQTFERLQRAERAHRAQMQQYRLRVAEADRKIMEAEEQAKAYQQAASLYEETKGLPFKATIDGKDYDSRIVAGQALANYANTHSYEAYDKPVIGSYRGYDIIMGRSGSGMWGYLRQPGNDIVLQHFTLGDELPDQARLYDQRLRAAQTWVNDWLNTHPGKTEEDGHLAWSTSMLGAPWPEPVNWARPFNAADRAGQGFADGADAQAAIAARLRQDKITAEEQLKHPFKRQQELEQAKRTLDEITDKIQAFEEQRKQGGEADQETAIKAALQAKTGNALAKTPSAKQASAYQFNPAGIRLKLDVQKIEPGRFLSDRTLMLDSTAITGSDLEKLQRASTQEGTIKQESAQTLWDSVVQSPTTPATILGVVPDDNKAVVETIGEQGEPSHMAVDAKKLRLMARITGFDEVRIAKASQGPILVAYKQNTPVGILMRFELPQHKLAPLINTLKAAAPAQPKAVTDAEQRLRENLTGERSGSGAQALVDQAIVTGYKLYRAGMTFAEWSRAMLKEMGQAVRPHLKATWDRLLTAVRQFIADEEGSFPASPGPGRNAWATPEEVLGTAKAPTKGLGGIRMEGLGNVEEASKKQPRQRVVIDPLTGVRTVQKGGKPRTPREEMPDVPEIKMPRRLGGRDLRSPLTTLNQQGTYEALAGSLGKQVSDAFWDVTTQMATGELSRTQGIRELRAQLRPIKTELYNQGYRGMPEFIDAHVKQIESEEYDMFGGAARHLTSLQYNLKLRFNPRAIAMNWLQPFQTLWPHFTTKEFVDLMAEARKRDVREQYKEIAARESGGKVEEATTKHPGWGNPFGMVSLTNRIMGHLAGLKIAERQDLTGLAKERMAAEWAAKVEYDNSARNVPPLFRRTPDLRGKMAAVLGQFKPFLIKNLERVAADWQAGIEGTSSGTLARRSKLVAAQMLIGGMKSLLLPGVQSLTGIFILAGLAKAFQGAGMDDDDANWWAEIAYFGLPAMIGQDFSSAVSLMDEPFGDTLEEQIVNFALGPTVSLATAIGTQGKDFFAAAQQYWKGERSPRAKRTPEQKMQGAALKLARTISPYTKTAIAGYYAVQGETPKMWLGKEERMTPDEAVGMGLMGTPVRQSVYWEKQEAYDWQKKALGMPTGKAGSGKPTRPTLNRPAPVRPRRATESR